jgi:hypothetical protein
MSWNPQQQAMLAAMGYTLYRGAGASAAASVEMPRTAIESPAGAGSAGQEGRLLQALRRAAGGRDLSGLALPPLETLRSDAAAKRRIWPVLRALRRR